MGNVISLISLCTLSKYCILLCSLLLFFQLQLTLRVSITSTTFNHVYEHPYTLRLRNSCLGHIDIDQYSDRHIRQAIFSRILLQWSVNSISVEVGDFQFHCFDVSITGVTAGHNILDRQQEALVAMDVGLLQELLQGNLSVLHRLLACVARYECVQVFNRKTAT